MVGQPGFFDLSDRLRELSAKGDELERIAALVDFGMFQPSWSGRCRAGMVARAAGLPSIAC